MSKLNSWVFTSARDKSKTRRSRKCSQLPKTQARREMNYMLEAVGEEAKRITRELHLGTAQDKKQDKKIEFAKCSQVAQDKQGMTENSCFARCPGQEDDMGRSNSQVFQVAQDKEEET